MKTECDHFRIRTNSEKAFWLCNGYIARSLPELLHALKKMNEPSFKYHVNGRKNEFSQWIEKVIGDKKLAKQLLRVKTQKTTITKIEKRVKEIK
jgi:hypothetical protein